MATDLERALKSLVKDDRGVPLLVQPSAQPIEAKVGVGKRVDPAKPGSGSLSHLIEPDYTARTVHDGVLITSSDGLFSFQALRTITFLDRGATVVIEFARPPS
jgi:hypothetical protein